MLKKIIFGLVVTQKLCSGPFFSKVTPEDLDCLEACLIHGLNYGQTTIDYCKQYPNYTVGGVDCRPLLNSNMQEYHLSEPRPLLDFLISLGSRQL